MKYDKQKSKSQRQEPAQQETPPGSLAKTAAPQPRQCEEIIVPRSHQVAKAAYGRILARQNLPEEKAYGALAHKLPVLILQNGLAQATGFLLAKNRPEHQFLLDDLAQVLRDSGESGCADRAALHATIINADIVKTMHLTRRALDASGWMKRYVQGVLKVDANGEVES